MPSLIEPGVECSCRLRLHSAIDYVQENVLGQGKQNNESAVEQAKDEQISVGEPLVHSRSHTDDEQDFIRAKYESTTGSKMPIQDKATSLDSSKD